MRPQVGLLLKTSDVEGGLELGDLDLGCAQGAHDSEKVVCTNLPARFARPIGGGASGAVLDAQLKEGSDKASDGGSAPCMGHRWASDAQHAKQGGSGVLAQRAIIPVILTSARGFQEPTGKEAD